MYMKLYHGSNVEVKNPDLNYSNRGRDFGNGFYLTSSLEQAKSWAKHRTHIYNEGKPTVSVYELDDKCDEEYPRILSEKEYENIKEHIIDSQFNDLHNTHVLTKNIGNEYFMEKNNMLSINELKNNLMTNINIKQQNEDSILYGLKHLHIRQIIIIFMGEADIKLKNYI